MIRSLVDAMIDAMPRILRKILKEIQKTVDEKPEVRQWLFARIVVPGLTVGLGALCFTGFGPISRLERELSIIPMASVRLSDGTIAREQGAIVLIGNVEGSVTLPWLWQRAPGPVRSSLTRDQFLGNSDKLQLSNDKVEIETPLAGGINLAAFHFENEPSAVLALDGTLDPRHFELPDPNSFALTLVTSVVAIFCFGLIAGTGRAI